MASFIDLQDDLIKVCLPALLADKTTKRNIVFATDSYSNLGAEYQANREIKVELLPRMDLKPRILKSQEEQVHRTRKKAEVFTPAWLCCLMNNHCDEEWFGRKDVFNHVEGEAWTTISGPISFPKKTKKYDGWVDYIKSNRIEITCGEAPYIVSRYDAATGRDIPLNDRIGILDRKMRAINENVSARDEWLNMTITAFRSVYGYEWQGDSLLIARINLLMTFIEYYKDRWEYNPSDVLFNRTVMKIVNSIVWNFWQMDGLSGTVPYGALKEESDLPGQISFFDMGWIDCPIVENGESGQNIECRIYDWSSNRSILYNSLKKG